MGCGVCFVFAGVGFLFEEGCGEGVCEFVVFAADVVYGELVEVFAEGDDFLDFFEDVGIFDFVDAGDLADHEFAVADDV